MFQFILILSRIVLEMLNATQLTDLQLNLTSTLILWR
jgi:hypothetical protein